MPSAPNTPAQPTSTITATVVEWVCVFTHDLRRKHKRWQDGRLKFHEFNRRVMVYDERGSFVDGTYLREGCELHDGQTLELDGGRAIAEVCYYASSCDRELDTPTKSKHAAAPARPQVRARTAVGPRPVVRQALPNGHVQPGAATGHHRRALVPSRSPCQLRQKEAEAAPAPRRTVVPYKSPLQQRQKEAEAAPALQRTVDPPPTTELRIKSGKKRGLLIMS